MSLVWTAVIKVSHNVHFLSFRKDLKFVSGVEEAIKNLVELVSKVCVQFELHLFFSEFFLMDG